MSDESLPYGWLGRTIHATSLVQVGSSSVVATKDVNAEAMSVVKSLSALRLCRRDLESGIRCHWRYLPYGPGDPSIRRAATLLDGAPTVSVSEAATGLSGGSRP